MNAGSMNAGWVVMLPVKGGVKAKTRLGSLGVADGGALAFAFARDLQGAVLAATEALGVIVVSSDAMVRVVLGADGIGGGHVGLGAVVRGGQQAHSERPM